MHSTVFLKTLRLSHFDKVFARPWATPSRLSHEDQHKLSLRDDDGIAGLTSRKAASKESKVTLFDERVQSLPKDQTDKKTEASEDDQDGTYISLKDYVSNHGFNSKCKTLIYSAALHVVVGRVSNNKQLKELIVSQDSDSAADSTELF